MMGDKGFNWDGETYTEQEYEGGAFIKGDDFDRIRLLNQVVQIVSIREGVSNFDPKHPKEQWLVDFIAPDGEEYTKGLTKGNEERDDRMRRFQATLEASGEPIESTPFKVGKRIEFGPPKV